jgi:hypothetical protein
MGAESVTEGGRFRPFCTVGLGFGLDAVFAWFGGPVRSRPDWPSRGSGGAGGRVPGGLLGSWISFKH